MLKKSILILALAALKCHCTIDITIDTEFTEEEDNYHKYKHLSNDLPKDYHKYEDVQYNLVKVSEPIKDTQVLNEDTYGFLNRIRKVVLHRPRKGKGKKPIYRQAITIIANSAQKDHLHGTRKLVTKNVPKMYMPVPQAISHILGKEHIPYGVYENLSHNYNYK